VTAAWRIPSDPQIHALLAERIDGERRGVGMVVGVVDRGGRRIVAHGRTGAASGAAPDGDSVFEIGSITKTFTSLLLADMARRGEAALDDPVQAYLPTGVTMPVRGRPITLADLATHRSGLPRWPSDLVIADWADPYPAYGLDQLFGFLSARQPARGVGEAYAYSNLGTGLLGQLLARRAGADFETLVRQRITGPLGMASTGIELGDGVGAPRATGHDPRLRPTPAWRMPTFAGAGALRSSAADMLIWLAANLGLVATPLAPAMAAQLRVRAPTDTADLQALGWRVSPGDGGEIVFHHGATGGFRCYCQFDLARRAGVVVLTNTAHARNDDLGFHILSGRPLAPPPPALAASELDRLAGRYALGPRRILVVEREDDRLFAKLGEQPWFELWPEGPLQLRWFGVDATATFELCVDGHAARMTLRQDGRAWPGVLAL
jgi:CubicO group peptidase (beta-lactamase class C family)